MPMKEKPKRNKSDELRKKFLNQVVLRKFGYGNPYRFIEENKMEYQSIINEVDGKSYSLMHHAVRKNDEHGVAALVQLLNADVNIVGKNGCTPLHQAVMHRKEPQSILPNSTVWSLKYEGQYRVIEFLMENGADVNAMDDYKRTPLVYAIQRNNYQGVEQLLKHGATTKLIDFEQMTPVLTAARNGSTEMLKLLLQYGCNLTELPSDRCSLFQFACQQSSNEMVKFVYQEIEKASSTLEAYYMINAANSKGETPLLHAVKSSSFQVMEATVELGATIQGDHLNVAAELGNPEMVSYFCIKAPDICKDNALVKAVESNHVEVVKILLNHGANANIGEMKHNTPIIRAITLDHEDVAIVFLNFEGCRLDVVNLENKCLIHLAVENENVNLVDALVKKKIIHVAKLYEFSQENLPDVNQNTAVHAAAITGNLEILKILNEANGIFTTINEKQMTPLHFAAQNGHLNACIFITSIMPSSVIRPDEDGSFAIHLTAMNNHPQVLKFFMENYGDENAGNYYGRTPLYFAAKNNNLECVQLLLNNPKVIVDVQDQTMVTPIFIACLNGNAKVVQCLIDHNADPTIKTQAEHTEYPSWNALDAAIHAKQLECTRIILDSQYWKVAMSNVTIHQGKFKDTPLRRMIRDLPEAADYILRKLVICNQLAENHPNFTIQFHFNYLEDGDDLKVDKVDKQARKQSISIELEKKLQSEFGMQRQPEPKTNFSVSHPVDLMIQYNRLDLLKTEIVQSLMAYKWIRVLLPYTVNVLLHFLFVAFFTSFMLQTTAPYFFSKEKHLSMHQVCENLLRQEKKAYVHFIEVPKYGVMLLSVFNILKEIIILIQLKQKYFSHEKVLGLIIYVLAIATTVDSENCMGRTGLREDWQWHTGVIGLILSWFGILLFIQNHLEIGIYVEIYVNLISQMTQLAIMFFPFIIAFAITFFLILGNQIGFDNARDAIMKTFVMFTGEIDLHGVLFNRYKIDADFGDAVPYVAITYILYIMFIVLMVVALISMIAGIAVFNVKESWRGISDERIKTLVNTFFIAQDMFSIFRIFSKVPEVYVVSPNASKKRADWLFLKFCPKFIISENIPMISVKEKEMSTTDSTDLEMTGKIVLENIKEYIDPTVDNLVEYIENMGKQAEENGAAQD